MPEPSAWAAARARVIDLGECGCGPRAPVCEAHEEIALALGALATERDAVIEAMRGVLKQVRDDLAANPEDAPDPSPRCRWQRRSVRRRRVAPMGKPKKPDPSSRAVAEACVTRSKCRDCLWGRPCERHRNDALAQRRYARRTQGCAKEGCANG